MTIAGGAGGLAASLQDMLAFDQAMREHALVSPPESVHVVHWLPFTRCPLTRPARGHAPLPAPSATRELLAGDPAVTPRHGQGRHH